MILNLRDHSIRAQIKQLDGQRRRLTLNYPADQPRYEEAVLEMLSRLLVPSESGPPSPVNPARER